MNSDPTLAELGIPEKIAGCLAAAGLNTLSAIEAEREAHESLVHLDGIGEAYDLDVAEAIEAWREMAVDAEPVDEEPIEQPAEEPVDEEPIEAPVAEEPIEDPVAEEPFAEVPIGQTVAEEPIEAPVAEAPIEEPLAEEPIEAPAEDPVTPSPRHPVTPEPPAPKPIDLLRHEAAKLSVLEEATRLLTDSLQEALEDFYRDRPVAAAPGKGELQRIVLRRDMVIGEAPQTIGTPLAVVQLEPGIDLNFLVDAVRNGLAAAK